MTKKIVVTKSYILEVFQWQLDFAISPSIHAASKAKDS